MIATKWWKLFKRMWHEKRRRIKLFEKKKVKHSLWDEITSEKIIEERAKNKHEKIMGDMKVQSVEGCISHYYRVFVPVP